MIRKTLLVGILSIFSFAVFSQDCFDYHKTHCFPKKSSFNYTENNSSVSFIFSPGDVREIHFMFSLGKDYRITLCADSIFENIIQFRILNEQGLSLYDNSKQNFNLNLEFSSKKTQDVIFEIRAPEIDYKNVNSVDSEGCIGVFIEEMISIKTGF